MPIPVTAQSARENPLVVLPASFFKTVAAAATPERASATRILCSGFQITGMKDRTTANTGTIWFGWTSANDTQLEPVLSGESRSLTAPLGALFDLSQLYIDVATAADGVLITYQPPTN